MASGMIGGAPKVAEETTLQQLARLAEERIATLQKQNHRIEGFLDRASPQPEAASTQTTPEQPIDMTLGGIQRRLATIGENLDRLSHLCDRLERIA